MEFPIKITFKLLALAPQMYVTDAAGRSLGYVRQKMLRIIEDVTVFTDESQATPIYSIKADRVIDFNAEYHYADAAGNPLGSLKRQGLHSLVQATYIISVGDEPRFEMIEENPWVRVIDGVIGNIPFVGALTGLFLNPTYLVSRQQGNVETLRIVKKRSLIETDFTIDKLGDLDERERECVMLATMMIILLERNRG